MNTLWTDILTQGENLGRVLEHLYGVEYERLQAAGQFLQNEKPIVFVGMGSAEYLCMSAAYYLGQYGRHASVINASDALYALLPALKQTNVVINTRSGETVEVMKLAHALVEAHIPFVAITNEPDSTVARLATHTVWSNSHKDWLVSINIVTAMMTTTLVLVAETLGHTETLRPALDRLPLAMQETVVKATAQAETLADLFAGIRPLYMLYRTASRSAAYCGQLVMEEVARHPTIAMDVATFRQGPMEVIDRRFGAFVFVGEAQMGDLNLALARDIQACGGCALVVGAETESHTNEERLLPWSLPPVPPHFRAVVEVIPAQVLAYKMAERQGYEPGTVRYISKLITTEAGIPREAQG
jgi:fructoselysine-6-P-deglycase FrlB-like protein